MEFLNYKQFDIYSQLIMLMPIAAFFFGFLCFLLIIKEPNVNYIAILRHKIAREALMYMGMISSIL